MSNNTKTARAGTMATTIWIEAAHGRPGGRRMLAGGFAARMIRRILIDLRMSAAPELHPERGQDHSRRITATGAYISAACRSIKRAQHALLPYSTD